MEIAHVLSGGKRFATSVLAVGLVFGAGCVSTSSAAGGARAVHKAQATNPAAAEPDEDCFAKGDVKARESCFSKKSADEIAECERMRLHACKPYKEMHILDQQLAELSHEVLAKARKQYAGYIEGDGAYLDDLTAYLRSSEKAWAAYRDADCLSEPFVQGMSRREAGDLTEACRAERTRVRIAELKELAAPLK